MKNRYLGKWGLPREEIPLCAWKVKATAWLCRIPTSFHSSNFLGKSSHDVLFQRNMKPEGLGATDCKWRNGANHFAVQLQGTESSCCEATVPAQNPTVAQWSPATAHQMEGPSVLCLKHQLLKNTTQQKKTKTHRERAHLWNTWRTPETSLNHVLIMFFVSVRRAGCVVRHPGSVLFSSQGQLLYM